MELNTCIRNGDLEGVKNCLKNGDDIHSYNDYALQYSAEHGHLEIVKYLLEKWC